MREKIGKLDCLVRKGGESERSVILLHGFGADASDLFPLANYLDPEQAWNFYFPEAPCEVPIGPMMTGRGWFPISVRELEAGIDFTKVRPPGMDAARDMVYDLIFHLHCPNLVLGGFSQGAMVSTEVALCNPQEVSGLVLWSGALLDQDNWSKKTAALKGKRFVQSHGQQDMVIPFAAGQKLFSLLKSGGLEGNLLGFPGGHEIPVMVLKKTQEFLREIFT